MVDLTIVTPVEEISSNHGALDLSGEEKGGHLVEIQVGRADEQNGNIGKEEKEQDPTILPKPQSKDGGEGLSTEENGEHLVHILDEAEMRQKGKDDKEVHILPMPEIKAVSLSAQNEKQKGDRKKKAAKGKGQLKEAVSLSPQNLMAKVAGQKQTVQRLLDLVNEKYKNFLVEADKEEIKQIEEILKSSDEDLWNDDVVSSELSRRAEVVRIKVKKLHDDADKRGKMLSELKTKLDQEVKEIRSEVEIGMAEAERRRVEAEKIEELVSELIANVRRIEALQKSIPIEQHVKKWTLAQNTQLWLDLKLEHQKGDFVYEEFVEELKTWNEELMKGTFLALSPDDKNKNQATMGRKAVLDFDKVEVERFVFNTERDTFKVFIQHLRNRACDHPQHGTINSQEGQFDEIKKCHLLEYQRTASKQPPRWFILELRSGTNRCFVYIRSDNLYICGFANQKGQIYELSNSKFDVLLKGSLPFGSNCDYPSLMDYYRTQYLDEDEDVRRLMALDLNMTVVSEDAIAMAQYDHTKADESKAGKEMVKRAQMAVARTAIVFPEVCRLLLLLGCVNTGWDNALGSHLDELLISLMRNWKNMSYALHNIANHKELAERGFQHLYLVLNAKGPRFVRNDKSKGDGPKPPPPSSGPDSGDGSERQSGPGNDGSNQSPESNTEGDDAIQGSPNQSPESNTEGDDANQGSPNQSPESNTEGDDATQGSSFVDEKATQDDRSKDDHDYQADSDGGNRGPLDCIGFSSVGLLDLLKQEKYMPVVSKGMLSSAKALVESLECGPSLYSIQLCGQRLVEIFSIHSETPFIKSISIYDGRCGNLIYKSRSCGFLASYRSFLKKREVWMSTTGMPISAYMEELPIIGPDRAMSALPGYIIEVDASVYGGGEDVVDLCWNWADRSCIDKPMMQTVLTRKGRVHLTSAVFSNAVQASVEVLLVLSTKSPYLDVTVAGKLVLQINGFTVGSTMFQSDNSEPSYLRVKSWDKKGKVTMSVPLTRIVYALPVDCTIHITGELDLWGGESSVSIDRSIELKHHTGLCKWPLEGSSLSGLPVASHAAIRIKTMSPF